MEDIPWLDFFIDPNQWNSETMKYQVARPGLLL